jgi:hypothetical protein
MNGVYTCSQLLEYFRVKSLNGPATCEQAQSIPVQVI